MSREVRLVNVTKRFGGHVAVDSLNLTVREGELVTLLGASGSGKTTCLRILAGFIKPDQGKVYMGNLDATGLPAFRRNTGMVFQQYALFPHLTVAENIAYGLKARRVGRAEIEERVAGVLRLVHMEAFGGRYPAQLSGGQQQRVALARAVVIRPSILLLDEPLSALDLKLRGTLQAEIRQVQQSLRITTLFVTHDQGEALGMSDRVAVMRNGQILQLDTPVDIYHRPNCRYVANFVGMTNFLDVVVRGSLPVNGTAAYGYALAPVANPDSVIEVKGLARKFEPGQRCLLCVRPENMRLANDASNRVSATVERVTFSGDHWVVECLHADGQAIAVSLSGRRAAPSPGERIDIAWDAEDGALLSDEE
ncbi:MAG TPA: ABC transporter ATP-binding protein [Alphaproteobacteria bacterium]|nr:ABC transporter ATP-binding protein [Alphaproteobacteria bacterium]